MSSYIYMAYLSLKTALVYKGEVWFGIFASMLGLTVRVFLWKALYADDSADMGISLGGITTYFILTAALSAFFIRNEVLLEVGKDVREGTIANYLSKPYSYQLSVLARLLGRSAYTLALIIVPQVILSVVLFGFNGPQSFQSLGLAILIAGVSIYIFFSIYFIAGLSSFWFMDIHGAVPLLLENMMMILSGSWIPLWLFPEWLAKIAYLLPMRFGFDLPLSIYVGHASADEITYGLLLEAAWVFLLWLTGIVVWRLSIRRLVIQGG